MTPHGRIARYNAGCRCDDCRRANRLRVTRWKMTTRYGALPTFVDGAPVRAHLAALKASGWTYSEVGREIGGSRRAVDHILYKNRAQVRRETANAILALEPLEPVSLDPVVVDRLIAGADWRELNATRAERLAAAERMSRAGESNNEIDRRLGLRCYRDWTPVRRAS